MNIQFQIKKNLKNDNVKIKDKFVQSVNYLDCFYFVVVLVHVSIFIAYSNDYTPKIFFFRESTITHIVKSNLVEITRIPV